MRLYKPGDKVKMISFPDHIPGNLIAAISKRPYVIIEDAVVMPLADDMLHQAIYIVEASGYIFSSRGIEPYVQSTFTLKAIVDKRDTHVHFRLFVNHALSGKLVMQALEFDDFQRLTGCEVENSERLTGLRSPLQRGVRSVRKLHES